MKIDVIFQKPGLVTVGTNEPGQDINLLDPFGKPIDLSFNFKTGQVRMVIESWDSDERNKIIREYLMDLPIEGWQALLASVFATHIRPLAKASFPEFDGLNDIGVEFLP